MKPILLLVFGFLPRYIANNVGPDGIICQWLNEEKSRNLTIYRVGEYYYSKMSHIKYREKGWQKVR